MIYWKKVDIGNYKEYVPKIIEYFYNVYLDKKIKPNMPNTIWNPIPLDHISMYFPELIASISTFGNIKEVSIVLFNNDNGTLHIDHTSGLNSGVQARLNIPLCNTTGSITAFYTDMHKYPSGFSPGGTQSWGIALKYVLPPITTVELSEPTILRTSEPHAVLCKKAGFPRITLTISFEEDIVKYLV